MKCPQCGHEDDKVIDTRVGRDAESIRRRRECVNCGYRFTTHEIVVRTDAIVVKRDGAREEFNPEKVHSGIRMACWKRPVSEEQIDQMVKNITGEVERIPEREITSHYLGELTMAELQNVDQVAYVRFASVYRRFKDVDQFVQEIQSLAHQDKS